MTLRDFISTVFVGSNLIIYGDEVISCKLEDTPYELLKNNILFFRAVKKNTFKIWLR